MDSDLREYVKRYTTLASALDILRNQRLTLLNTRTWDDTNDSYFIDLYKEYTGAKAVLALCCTMAPERYHHWKIFSNGIEGVCLELKRQPLERALPTHDAHSGPVDYETLAAVEKLKAADALGLPFLKRQGFSDEREWRIIAHRDDPHLTACHIPIDRSWIHRVVLNPWMPETLTSTIRNVIKGQPGCEKLSVVSSHLTNSKRWKAAGDRMIGKTPLPSASKRKLREPRRP